MKHVPITGTTLAFLLLFLCTFLSTSLAQSLLIPPLEGVELPPEEADRRATAEALPFAGGNALIEIGNLAESFRDDVLQAEFPLIGCGTLTLETIHSEYESESNYRWYGRITDDLLCECREGFLLLISEEGQKFGHLDIGGETYDIALLSEERHFLPVLIFHNLKVRNVETMKKKIHLPKKRKAIIVTNHLTKETVNIVKSESLHHIIVQQYLLRVILGEYNPELVWQ